MINSELQCLLLWIISAKQLINIISLVCRHIMSTRNGCDVCLLKR